MPHFIYSSVDGHLDVSHFLWRMLLLMHKSLCGYVVSLSPWVFVLPFFDLNKFKNILS